VDEKVRAIRRGDGLGGRMLGEEGTTGGTTVGKELQDEMEHADATDHPYDPGMAGRTGRGGLGHDQTGNDDEDDSDLTTG
jgi:hypothetical protein